MRNYEVAYISDPEMDEQAQTDLEAKVASWIEAAGGTTLKVDRWGKRRLAYSIKKHTDGYYVFYQVQLPPQSTRQIERDLRLTENILRFLVTLQDQA
ncbi:MAG: 30S ribosomal protein S6 [Chloroflexi bacterium RBG_19FT_COMBO_62_14]|nr:MAG: 30S ribosomal protein S6 [Chloroflexi bacterium RBG_19FT_COMBO_62_14]